LSIKTTLALLALAALLGACSSNAGTPTAEATAPSTAMASTTVGEQFMEANVKEDSVKLRSLLADDMLLLGTSLRERMSGKDTVSNLMVKALCSTLVSTPKKYCLRLNTNSKAGLILAPT
jgi:hypothetical protein